LGHSAKTAKTGKTGPENERYRNFGLFFDDAVDEQPRRGVRFLEKPIGLVEQLVPEPRTVLEETLKRTRAFDWSFDRLRALI
jgi:hypothetical protein